MPERHGQMGGQTDRFAISISRDSMLTRDKNSQFFETLCTPSPVVFKLFNIVEPTDMFKYMMADGQNQRPIKSNNKSHINS